VAPRGTFRQIADQLREAIRRGDLPPGAMVPSELALVERHGVARGTVRSALAMLVDEGLIEVVPGQGRRVVGRPVGSVPTTTYERIAADLVKRLDAGEFGPTDALPSESALVAEYGVSRNTVRRAYQYLAEVGAVVIRHGAGAYPAPR
jgi:DNA-binding GntR family transcriptional regulator